MALTYIFKILSALVSVYTFLCFLRIILTWIPTLNYSKFTQVISRITDPYLNLFRRFKFLIIGSFDFSPAVALCILSIISTILTNFSHGGHITLGIVLAMLLQMLWSIAASILVFLIVLFLIRFIIMLVRGANYRSMLMDQLDSGLYRIVYNIVRPFVGKNRITYKTALLTSSIILIIVNVAGSILVGQLANLISRLPF